MCFWIYTNWNIYVHSKRPLLSKFPEFTSKNIYTEKFLRVDLQNLWLQVTIGFVVSWRYSINPCNNLFIVEANCITLKIVIDHASKSISKPSDIPYCWELVSSNVSVRILLWINSKVNKSVLFTSSTRAVLLWIMHEVLQNLINSTVWFEVVIYHLLFLQYLVLICHNCMPRHKWYPRVGIWLVQHDKSIFDNYIFQLGSSINRNWTSNLFSSILSESTINI